MAVRIAAEGFLPGEFIAEELDARGWSQADLADILGKAPGMVNELIKGKRKVTPEIAQGLSAAFGTTAEYWTNLETAYQYWLLRKRQNELSPSARKARLMSIVPYRELARRGWIESSSNVDVLEQNVHRFLGIDDTGGPVPPIQYAARRSSSYAEVSPSLRAYLCRAKELGNIIDASSQFTREQLASCLPELKSLADGKEKLRFVPAVLSQGGARLVVIEHLAGTKIDGATVWLEDGSPVIAMSLRYDRIDSFWFTLMHEIGHIMNGDGNVIDSDLLGSDSASDREKPENERQADVFAAEFLIPRQALQVFINNKSPLYYKKDIQGFARVHHVHPGIVVGQLQYRGELKYHQMRELLEKVRYMVTDIAITDGWGSVAVV